MRVSIFVTLLFSCLSFSQTNAKISSMDFVQIQNNNIEEAMYYYHNNWKKLRIKALEKNYIDSYQLLKNEYSEAAPFHIILITTYKNKTQFEAREKHFQELIDGHGELMLLNNKTPKEFRKTVFGTDAKHLN